MSKKTLGILLISVWVGSAVGAPLAPDSGSLDENLCLWLRMPEVNYDPGAGIWTDVSSKGNDARADVANFVGPSLSSGENAAVFAHPFGAVHCDPAVAELLRATNLNGGAGLTDLTIFSVVKLVEQGGADQRPVGFGAYTEGNRADAFNMSFDVTVRKNNGFISGKNQDHPVNEFVIYAARMRPDSINMWFNSTGTLDLAFTAAGSSYTTATDEFFVGECRYSPGGDFDIAEVVVFNTALTDAQIEGVSEWLQAYVGVPAMVGASGGYPEDGMTDVSRDVELSWTPVATAVERDVYIGTLFDDVNDAGVDSPTYMGRQQENSFDPGRLALGQTYFWRIDEVNSPPDSTVFKGSVWSFTVEPVSYPVPMAAVSATASSAAAPQDPNNTINGSGMDENDLHSSKQEDMWLGDATDPNPSIEFTFSQIEKLDKVHVWNHNTQTESILGFGIKEALIEYSVDGANWTEFGTVTLSQATGSSQEAGAAVPLDGILAKVVKVTGMSNYSLLGLPQMGLSEVRFYSIPVLARDPMPANGSTSDGVDVTLQWRTGREAVEHEVVFSTDEQAVIDGSAVVATVSESSYDLGTLDLGMTYFWKINEMNDLGTPPVYEGDLWTFLSPDHLMIDDFEMYKAQEGLRIWEHWFDGFDDQANNGAVVGNGDDAEKSVVYEGSQSMPIAYNNTLASKSEVTRFFDTPLDLTKGSAENLRLQAVGDPNNGAAPMYVVLADTAGKEITIDHPDPAATVLIEWDEWTIPLGDLSPVDITMIDSITVGVGSPGVQGKVFIDAIRTDKPYPTADLPAQ